jgi:RNA polymerase sigma-70 factor (ECF subfamily)
MSDPDVVLMLRFKDGDYEAFGKLVGKYTRPLVNYFYFQCGDRDRAEECTQELWSKIFRSRSDYLPRATFATYVFRVARNLWIDVYRAGARRPSTATLSGDPDEDSGGAPLSDRLADVSGPDPGEVLESRELAGILARALGRLPPEMREVFVLAEVEELPYAEIASTLGIPVGTVKSRMFNAVRRLREILGRSL